mmetsp:Transcript_22404/g.41721  ORF Transcript_22404/g.41721 Transcript_22404/m.41721 type:complete len:318 (+) Transcript_22404:233-1186(+)
MRTNVSPSRRFFHHWLLLPLTLAFFWISRLQTEAFHIPVSGTTTSAINFFMSSQQRISPPKALHHMTSTSSGEKDANSGDSSVTRPTTGQEQETSTVLPETTVPSSSSILVSSIVSKIGSTTSIAVAGTFYAVLCYKRDAYMVSFFVGAICNGILSKVLKKVLKQERPAELDTAAMELAPSDNGMPSSHAMSLGFIFTFTALQVPWTALPLLAYAVVSLIYRVQSNLHSFDQIAVGAVLGSFNGALWWQMCTGANNPLGVNVVEWISSTPFINNQGLLPCYLLSVPALVGAAVVGSVERRLARFFKDKKNTVDAKED